MDLYRTVIEIKGDICQIFPPVVFSAPADGDSLEFCKGVGSIKTRMTPLSECQKVWRYVHSFNHTIGTGVDRRTERRTKLIKQYRALYALPADAR